MISFTDKYIQNICMGIRETFIMNLKYYRKQAGITQEKLAEAVGMNTSYIGALEACGRFPSPETIDKIASALGIRPAVLFDETASPEAIKSSFKKEYATSLKEELSRRVLGVIDEVCEKI